ncbi:DUF4190 domain-containing protein [Catellatospora sp. NPDC049609]|uniref:DUF4190 domain-containing protein n=1 Tax=Catellatospora sp. NPDC049609 TaxID=3155505 RepID=UPI0034322235
MTDPTAPPPGAASDGTAPVPTPGTPSPGAAAVPPTGVPSAGAGPVPGHGYLYAGPPPVGWPHPVAAHPAPPGGVYPYPGQPYAHPGYPPHPYALGRRTNGMAIASMVTALLGLATICLYGIPTFVLGPTGAIMGHITRRRIRTTGEEGDGMALAGIIIGWVGTGLAVMWLAVIVFLVVWSAEHPPATAPEGSF